MISKIIPLIPPHKLYVEVFGGGGAVLFAKEPAKYEVYNDLDSGLTNFFSIVKDPEQYPRFRHYAVTTPFSRSYFYKFCEEWENEKDPAIRAYKWYVINRMSFGGLFGNSWGSAINTVTGNMVQTCASWIAALNRLDATHERLQGVTIHNEGWEEIFGKYADLKNALIYCDPPYVMESRKAGEYSCEMTNEEHEQFVVACLRAEAKIIISGYDHSIYNPLVKHGWEMLGFNARCHIAGRTNIQKDKIQERKTSEHLNRVEVLWLSPQCISSGHKKLKTKLFEEEQ